MGRNALFFGLCCSAIFSIGCTIEFIPNGPDVADTADGGGDTSEVTQGVLSVAVKSGTTPVIKEGKAGNVILEITDNAGGSVGGLTVAVEKPAELTGATNEKNDQKGEFTWSWTPPVGFVTLEEHCDAAAVTVERTVTVTFNVTDPNDATRTATVDVDVIVTDSDSKASDLDDDGLSNDEEATAGTDNCKPDSDADGVLDGDDNCPATDNPKVGGVQPDTDGDGQGDECDGDLDGDGTDNGPDNCPNIANIGQEDLDGDNAGDLCDADDDGDGTDDTADNCPIVANTTQADLDGDNVGDACDSDDDGDGKDDDVDNCPVDANPGQSDLDGDDIGDACDDDDDGDGVPDETDNCPVDANPLPIGGGSQADLDGDKVGDICDPDIDGDEDLNEFDNCPLVPNPGQGNKDGDTLGDLCDDCPDDVGDDSDGDDICGVLDNCPIDNNPLQEDGDKDGIGDACDDCPDDADNDIDVDTICGDVDNCPGVFNTDQADADSDGEGDVCDLDKDGDSIANTADNCPAVANNGQEDLDDDGIGDVCDPDGDGDEVDDSVDNCPLISNPKQTDVDGDGVGIACDDYIALLDNIGGVVDEVISLTTRGGGTGLVVSKGESAQVFAMIEPETVVSKESWVSLGTAWPVFVMQTGEVVFSAKTKGGGSLFQWLTENNETLSELKPTTVQPVFVDAGDDKTLFHTNNQLAIVGANSLVVNISGGGSFVDSSGHKAMRDTSGTIYQPVREVTGTKYSLQVVSPGLTPIKLLNNRTSLSWVTADPTTGGVFYCEQTAGSDPVIVLLNGGTSTPWATLAVAKSCIGIEGTRTQTGDWIYVTEGKTGPRAVSIRKSDGTVITGLASAPAETQAVRAGSETYVVTDDTALSVRWWDATVSSALILVSTDCDDYNKSQRIWDTSSSGVFGVVGRDSTEKAGICLIKGNASVGVIGFEGSNVSPSKVWMGPGGTFFMNVTAGGQPLFGYAGPVVVGGVLKGVAFHEHASIPGTANVSIHGETAIASFGGTKGGVFSVQVNQSGAPATFTAITTTATTHIDLFGALTLGDAAPADGLVLNKGWIAVPVGGVSSYSVFAVGKSPTVGTETVLTKILGPPSDIRATSDGRYFFTTAGATAALGKALVEVGEDGTVKAWLSGMNKLSGVTYTERDEEVFWGVAFREASGVPFTVCELPPNASCWSFPVAGHSLISGPVASPDGRAVAVTRDDTKGITYLWRNTAPEVDSPFEK